MTAPTLPSGGRPGEAPPATALKTEVRIWQAPELAAELPRGDFHDFSYDVYTHDTACFALITSGAIRIRMRGSEFVARQGDLYAIDADELHAGGPLDPGGWRQCTVYVRTEHLCSLLSDGEARGGAAIRRPIIGDARLNALFYRVHQESEVQGDALRREERYLRFVARLFERHVHEALLPGVSGIEPRAVRLAREFRDARLDQQVHLEEIAGAAGVPLVPCLRAPSRHDAACLPAAGARARSDRADPARAAARRGGRSQRFRRPGAFDALVSPHDGRHAGRVPRRHARAAAARLRAVVRGFAGLDRRPGAQGGAGVRVRHGMPVRSRFHARSGRPGVVFDQASEPSRRSRRDHGAGADSWRRLSHFSKPRFETILPIALRGPTKATPR
ncbi:MAG: AraC family ligand binding domain-containing protein [Burkholderia sp.]